MAYGIPHPEAQPGEILLSNTDNVDISWLPWKTARLGVIAYDRDNQPISRLHPVFVMRDELTEAGVNPDNIYNF